MNDQGGPTPASDHVDLSRIESTEIMRRLNFFVSGIILAGTIMFALFAVQVIVWAYDTKPPFEVLTYKVDPTSPGHTASVNAQVQRQLNRGCSVTYARFFFDSSNNRFEITHGSQGMNATALEDLERRSPGQVNFTFRVPNDAERGRGTIVTSLEYVCNPLHRIWPIQVLMKNELEVL